MGKKKLSSDAINEFVVALNGALSKELIGDKVDIMMENEGPNFWRIIEYGDTKVGENDKSAHETRYSRMIRWLLDPRENHQLGFEFVRRLLSMYSVDLEGADYGDGSVNTDNVLCKTEEKDIDVYYEDDKIRIAIEVKQYSVEHDHGDSGESQLVHMKNVVEEKAEGDKEKKKALFIYLTPCGDEPSEGNEDVKVMDYRDLIDIVDGMIGKSQSLDFIKIAKDFRSDLKYTEMQVKLVADKSKINEFAKNLQNGKGKKNYFSEMYDGIFGEDAEYDTVFKYNQIVEENGYDRNALKRVADLIKDNLYIQDHTGNPKVDFLMRNVAEHFTGVNDYDCTKKIPLCLDPSKNEKYVKSEYDNLIANNYISVKRTNKSNGVSMGLYFFIDEERELCFYCSGGTKGLIPNVGYRISDLPNRDGELITSVPKFNVDDIVKEEDGEYSLTPKFDELLEVMKMMMAKGVDTLDEYLTKNNMK